MVSKEEFKEQVREIATEINAVPRQIRIRNMKRKIGSCSPGKVITFNNSILDMCDASRKEAIIHELLHLRYRNHGKMFNTVLKAYLSREK